jgi:hypothetical protein
LYRNKLSMSEDLKYLGNSLSSICDSTSSDVAHNSGYT